MQAAFVKHDGYQCGYCTPGQICSAVAVLDEIKAGVPSHVSADLTAATATQRRRAARAHERQHLPLRRLFEHRRGDHRSAGRTGMKPSPTSARRSPSEAAAAAARNPGAKFIAGGTNLLDLMKLQIETPTHLVDVNGLALDKIEPTSEGGLRIGALVRNTALAADERVRRDYGVLSRALLAGASGQLRNMATTAGNLLQRTRCPYFYNTNQPCNKSAPGSGCSAIGGFSRQHRRRRRERSLHRHASERHGRGHAVLDAAVETRAAGRLARSIPIADFYRLPGHTPHIETDLEQGADHGGDVPKPVGDTEVRDCPGHSREA